MFPSSLASHEVFSQSWCGWIWPCFYVCLKWMDHTRMSHDPATGSIVLVPSGNASGYFSRARCSHSEILIPLSVPPALVAPLAPTPAPPPPATTSTTVIITSTTSHHHHHHHQYYHHHQPPPVPAPAPPSLPPPPSWHSLLEHWDSGWDLLPYKRLVSFLSGISQVEITFHNVFLLLFSGVLSCLPAAHVNIRTPGAEQLPDQQERLANKLA